MSAAVDVSRFGSPRVPVAAAGAVLRARAGAVGVPVRDVSPEDLAAAVIAADAWVALTGASSLDRPLRFGAPAVRVLSAVLTRAAGWAEPHDLVPVHECPSDTDLLRLAEEHAAWSALLVGSRTAEVLVAAAADLWAAGPETVFSAYGSLLAVAH